MTQAEEVWRLGIHRVLLLFRAAINGFGKIDADLSRRFWMCITAFTIIFFACSVALDLRMKMWIDELYTLIMAQQTSAIEILKATREGCDGMPPLYAILVHVILPWMPNQEIAVRLPSTLGFCGMLICISAFCRRRMPASYAMTTMLLACIMSLTYSNEGRSYGIILGCAGGALLSWQLAIDGLRRNLTVPLFAFFLALMTAMHYYAFFFLFPFIVAEAVRWKRSGKIDSKLMGAMTPVAAVLLLHYPLIAASAKFQKHYWSPATWTSVILSWGDSLLWVRVNLILPLLLLIVVSSVIGPKRVNDFLRSTLRLPEWMAMGTFYLLPPSIAALSIYTTHVFVDRYVVWVTPALAVLFIGLICAVARSAPIVGVAVLAFFLVVAVNDEFRRLSTKPLLRKSEEVSVELAHLPSGGDPIVIADHQAFMELSHYSAPALRERLLYLDDPGLDLYYFHNDTGALLMRALRNRTNLHIEDLDAALARHEHFFLAAKPSDYLPNYLLSSGWRVELLHSSSGAAIYEVSWNSNVKPSMCN